MEVTRSKAPLTIRKKWCSLTHKLNEFIGGVSAMNKILLLLIVLILSGCASSSPPRPEYTNLPPLEKGWGRIYVGAGSSNGVKLWSVHQVGPVFINEQRAGSVAKNEHIAVDLLPGTYEAHWVPDEPEKFHVEKTAITIKAGETRYFTCDLENRVGTAFGLVGAIASDYLQNGRLTEQPSLDSSSKLASYRKFNDSSNSNAPASVVNPLNSVAAPANVQANESVSQKLRELQRLRTDGVITEDEFQKKKQQLLDKF